MMQNRIPQILFFLALSLLLIGYGTLIGKYELFPFEIISSGIKTGKVLISNVKRKDVGMFWGFVDVPPKDAASKRISFLMDTRLSDPVLFFGGRFQFTDHCPGEGCLAVEYSTNGEVVHAYPFRPDEINKANSTDEFAYERLGFVFSKDARPIGIQRYDNGDLLVVFHNLNTFPFGGGVARIDREGHPVWFRRDYSHHWPTLLEGGTALVPNLKIGSESISVDINGKDEVQLDCDTGKPLLDTINVLDEKGRLLRQISIVEPLLNSPFRGVLMQSTDPCDPTHLNSVIRLPENFTGIDNAAPGDFVVSLRNVSAFGIIDGQNGRFKRLFRGTFIQQHSVRHLEGTKFLLFDNLGGDEAGNLSRLLMIDVATGLERTLFPTKGIPKRLEKLFSREAGKVDISPDRQRAIVTFSEYSMAFEVRISDGKLLNIFSSVHDLSDLTQHPDERKMKAAVYYLYGVDYIDK